MSHSRVQFIEQDFIAYAHSISEELRTTQNRVRNLIGNAHWQTDGEHKEAVLRRVLRTHLPESVRVGKGFVCYPGFANLFAAQQRNRGSSGQLDIIITAKNRPTLFKEGELVFVTADAVEAIVEVKTRLRRGNVNRTGLVPVLSQLANQVESIRRNARQKRCLAGLFAYEPSDEIDHRYLMTTIQEITQENPDRVIDYITLGPDTFVHFWENGDDVDSPIAGPLWHSYMLGGLSQSYFVSNIVISLSPGIPDEAQLAWFPIEGGKETRRCYYTSLRGGVLGEFA